MTSIRSMRLQTERDLDDLIRRNEARRRGWESTMITLFTFVVLMFGAIAAYSYHEVLDQKRQAAEIAEQLESGSTETVTDFED